MDTPIDLQALMLINEAQVQLREAQEILNIGYRKVHEGEMPGLTFVYLDDQQRVLDRQMSELWYAQSLILPQN